MLVAEKKNYNFLFPKNYKKNPRGSKIIIIK
ncbi:MAG: hypothetical protein MRECE_62c002 [Mycoplasmataceae bacterium CE_OT135]|nr:MAG: hypothetical protein MRECE_62c002 [Mycoplasmataceae bacterium CE_OT135]